MGPTEIAVVGGGPAGAYCALELARRCVHATIFNRSYSIEKPCGGGVSPATLAKFPFLEQFRSKGSNSEIYQMITCTEKKYRMKIPNPGFNISRQFLDHQIQKMAIESGAKLIEEKVISINRKQDTWQIETTKRSLTARVLVGADGVNSIVRQKTVGSIRKENLGLTYGYLVTGVEDEPTTMKFMVEIPGYIWIFPRGNHSSIGIFSNLKFGSELKRILDNFILSYCPQIKILSHFAALLPSATDPEFFKKHCVGDDWILVGDAAGHVDPISGEGILYALWSGKLAAQVIGANQLKTYDNLWRREYGFHLMERCRLKEKFFDPLTIEMSALLANNSYSNWPIA
ncbi:MAG TPA: hypothetical protein DGG95_12110 [Cytophagales bacterium]|nr:hypothetical protein [Cytophagales bacterium]